MHLTFKQYRRADLMITAFLLCFFETIIILSANAWFQERQFSVSLTFAFIAFVMMRWNHFAFIHALLAGIVFSVCMFATENGLILNQLLLIYCGGNLFSLLALLMFIPLKKSQIKDGFLLTILFQTVVFILIIVGRTIFSFLLGDSIFIFFNYLFYDSASLLFSIIIVLVLRRLDGMFEDQKAYLFKLDKERQKEIETQNLKR